MKLATYKDGSRDGQRLVVSRDPHSAHVATGIASRLQQLRDDWSLHHRVPTELAKGFGFPQPKPATAFGPVAVTPDELGAAWRGGRMHLSVSVAWNRQGVGQIDAGAEMSLHFGQLIAHIARTRNVRAGSIVGSGTVSQRDAATYA